MSDKKSESGKKVISNSIIYTLSGLLLKCFSFFLLPLYTAYLTTEDYGVTSVANSFSSTMSFIVAFSLFSAVMRFYVELKEDQEKLRRFYGTIVGFVFISSIVIGLILCLFQNLVSRYIFSGTPFYPAIIICVVTLVFNCQQQIYVNILRSQQKAMKCSILSIAYFFITLFFNITFVVFFHLGATGVLLASLIANIIYTVYFVVDMIRTKSMTLCIDVPLLKEALAYSIPIMPHDLSTRLAQLVSKALIGGTSTLASLGLFSVASQFGDIADTIQSYVHNAYGPWLFEKLHDKEQAYKKQIRSVVNGLCGVLGFFFIGIALFSQDYIFLCLNSKYAEAWKYVPGVVMVYAIKTMYYFYVSILLYYKKASRVLFVSTLTSSLINILISAICIPVLGVYGSILADAIAMLIRVIICVFIACQFDEIGLKKRDFIANFFVVGSFICIGLLPSYIWNINHFNVYCFIYRLIVLMAYTVYLLCRFNSQIAPLISRFKRIALKRKA